MMALRGRSSSGFGRLLGVAMLGALYWFTRVKKDPAPKGDGHSAAFSDGETHPEIFDQPRTACPDGMRDTPQRSWDQVDQAADESIPASDPPATY